MVYALIAMAFLRSQRELAETPPSDLGESAAHTDEPTAQGD